MRTPLLSIQHLSASIGSKPILHNFCLDIFPGEIHAIMGPNGTGKSTLAKVLIGHPDCMIEEGTILFNGTPLQNKKPDERAALGLFLGFQYPFEIKGLSNKLFLQQALNCQRKANNIPPMDNSTFQAYLDEKMSLLNMKSDFKDRDVNEGFSGGEKKKNEILQMALLNPRLSILDEIDSGLDIDALKAVSKGIVSIMKEDSQKALLLITHYPRILDYIKPDVVHVMVQGTIVKKGTMKLAQELEQKGYELVGEEIP